MTFLLWLDASPARFWTVAFLLLAAFLASALAPATGSGRGLWRLLRHPAAFLVLGGLTILAFRWPALYFPRLLDHDEAQMGAQALKYFTDIIPWRSVDGTTSGPLNSWWLMVPGMLGMTLDWGTIRFMGLVCVFATFFFTYGTLKAVADDALARVAVLPLVFFYLFVVSISFLHYTSEHVPVMLLSGAIYFSARFAHADGVKWSWLIPAAMLFGAVPFAKLQPTPLGALGGLFLLAVLIGGKKSADGKMPGKGIAVWAGAGLSVPLLVLALVAIGGALGDFFTSYPGQLKTFKELGHPGGSIGGLLRNDQQEIALVTGGVLAGVVLLVMAWRREGRGLWSLRKPVAWAFIYLGGAIFCVVWSGKNYPHYFLFWVHPICLCLGVLAATVCGKRSDAGENRDEPRVAGFAPWCCVAPVLVAQLSMLVLVAPAHPHAGRVAKYLEAPKEGVVQAILQVAQPGDRMTVWGMTPSFYVDSGLAPGTRDAMTQMQILKTSRQAYYRERFMADLKKSRPKFFVDTDSPYLMMTGGSYVDYVKLPQHGHEVFPELAAFVRENYRPMFDSPIGETGYKIRVYARK